METFYITKYALTGGIIEIQSVAKTPDFLGGREWVKHPSEWAHFYVGRDAFRVRADAVVDAERRRTAKIDSLKKQIGKLEKVAF